MLSEVQLTAGHYSEAVLSLTKAMGGRDIPTMLALRAIAYEKAGQMALADADLANARKKAKLPADRNNICWELAIHRIALKSALADCDSAVAAESRNSAFLDGRGLVLLRLAQYDKAIADYDSALRINPFRPTALYGRGICELREGKIEQGNADIRAATVLSYEVADEFAHYGVRP